MPRKTLNVMKRSDGETANDRAIGQGEALTGLAGDQERQAALGLLDHHGQPTARLGHVELVARLHVDERRDVEILGAAMRRQSVAGACALHLERIDVLAAEGVLDLVNDRRQPPVFVAEVDADRVEDVAEQSREAEQPDAGPCQLDTRFGQPRQHPGLQWRAVAGAMVGGAKAEEIAALDREQPEAPVDRLGLVQVQEQREDPVGEAVTHRPQPVVHDAALVEAGIGCGRVMPAAPPPPRPCPSRTRQRRPAAPRAAPRRSCGQQLPPSAGHPHGSRGRARRRRTRPRHAPWISPIRAWAATAARSNTGWA